MPIAMKYGNFNLLETSGPVQAYIGIAKNILILFIDIYALPHLRL
jgi:hypothetical protein